MMFVITSYSIHYTKLYDGSPTDLSDLDKNDDNQIQMVILKGEQGHQDAEKRTSEIIRVLEDYGYTLRNNFV